MFQAFRLQRFVDLLHYDLRENGKFYLITWIVILSFMIIFMIPLLFTREGNATIYVIHLQGLFLGLILGGTIFISTSFGSYHQTDKAIYLMMIPAHKFEKYLVKLTIFLSILLLNLIVFFVLHINIVEQANQQIVSGYPYYYQKIPENTKDEIIYLYLLLSASFFLGSIFFYKNSYLKTAGYSLIIFLFFYLADLLLLKLTIEGVERTMSHFPFHHWSVIFNNKSVDIYIEEPMLSVTRIALITLLLVIFISAYIRLKEKEV